MKGDTFNVADDGRPWVDFLALGEAVDRALADHRHTPQEGPAMTVYIRVILACDDPDLIDSGHDTGVSERGNFDLSEALSSAGFDLEDGPTRVAKVGANYYPGLG